MVVQGASSLHHQPIRLLHNADRADGRRRDDPAHRVPDLYRPSTGGPAHELEGSLQVVSLGSWGVASDDERDYDSDSMSYQALMVATLQFLIADAVVIWRAFVLFAGTPYVQGSLILVTVGDVG